MYDRLRIRSMTLSAAKSASAEHTRPSRRSAYNAPADRHAYPLADLLIRLGRAALEDRQLNFLRDASSHRDPTVFYSGDMEVLDGPAVSIVGTREVSDAGWKRASQLARDLARTA